MKRILLFSLLTLFFHYYSKAQNNLCFSAVQTTTIPVWCLSMSKADFNSDGYPDICCESIYGISVLLSNSNGSYNGLTTYSIGVKTNIVITDDFNNDGHADIASVSSDSNKVIIVLGTGTGTVLSINSFSVGLQPNNIVSSDFNNDGNIDLAITNYLSNNVSIFKGNGNGNFTYITNYSIGTNPTNIVTGDFNNDGMNDMLITANGSTKILKGNGACLFAVTTYINFSPYYLITEDVNSDGKLDLIYTDINFTGLHILTGNGNYSFNITPTYSINSFNVARGLATSDFNNDGKIDIVYTSCSSNTPTSPCDINILFGQSSGLPMGPISFSLSASSFYQPNSFIPADVNNDGKMDIIGCVDNDPEFRILYNCNAVGLKENSNKADEYLIYPNPCIDILNIDFAPEKINFDKFQIINSLGQIIRDEKIDFKNKIASIKTDELPNGVYHLVLSSRSIRDLKDPSCRQDDKLTASKRFVIAR